jgi:hypothetical protein
MAKKNSNTVSLTKTTTTTIYKMDTLNGLRRSSVTETTEVIEVAEEVGFDPLEVRDAADIRRFRRQAESFMDRLWFGSDE